MAERPLYLFMDESGSFDFRPGTSKYFVLTAIVTADPTQGVERLLRLRHHMLGLDPATLGVRKPHDYSQFHCAMDPQNVRDSIFKIIGSMTYGAHCIVAEKCKANPVIQSPEVFYNKVFRGLVRGIVVRDRTIAARQFQVFSSAFKVRAQRKDAFIAGMRATLDDLGIMHRVHIHPALSHHMLQVADYVGWAVARKWEHGDTRSYNKVRCSIHMEFPIFRGGDTRYYEP